MEILATQFSHNFNNTDKNTDYRLRHS